MFCFLLLAALPQALQAQLSFSPTSLSFAPTAIGSSSTVQSFTVTNNGSAAVTPGTATISPNFAVTTNTCSGNSLAAAGTCAISVDFVPTVSGALSGTLSLPASGTTYTATLSGKGTLVSPALTAFPAQALPGNENATVTFSFTAAATLTSVSVVTQGVTGLDFTAGTQIPATQCKAQAYAKNATCTVVVNFKPSTPGLRTGAVLLYDNEATPAIIGTAFLNGVGTSAQAACTPAPRAPSSPDWRATPLAWPSTRPEMCSWTPPRTAS